MTGTALRILIFVSMLIFVACEQPQKAGEAQLVTSDGDASAALERMSEEFRRKVYTVTDGVYQAVGFGIANSIMVEGDECVFIVDVMGSMETAKEVKAEFDKITQKPIAALIYTHNHADHVMGGLAFVPDGKVDVYAHETTNYYPGSDGERRARPVRRNPRPEYDPWADSSHQDIFRQARSRDLRHKGRVGACAR
jgi:glyoxylase-like metal-dependent hydrolase (beta-lactamase superfamily II)